MDYIKIRFGDELEKPDSGWEKSLEDMFRSLNPMFSLSERCWKPQLDIYETPEEIFILAEIAGVDKDNLEVEISPKAVRLQGHRPERRLSSDATYRLAEIQYGRFERIIYLPSPIDPDVVSASYANGFLTIRMAKRPADRPHKVAVQDG